MKDGAMARDALNFFADNTKFVPHSATRIVNVWQERAETDGEVVNDFPYY